MEMTAREYIDLYDRISDSNLRRKANEEAERQSLYIMDPYDDRDNPPEEKWLKFKEQHRQLQRMSDWIAIDVYGVNNQDIYDMLMSIHMSNDIPNPTINGSVGTSDDSIHLESYVAASDKVDVGNILASITDGDLIMKNRRANEYIADTGRIILCPCLAISSYEELDKYWLQFNTMVKRHRRMSDWECLEIYGFTNTDYYKYMLVKLHPVALRVDEFCKKYKELPIHEMHDFRGAKRYIQLLLEDEDSTPNEIAECLTSIYSDVSDTFSSIIAGDIVTNSIEKYDGLTSNVPTMNINVGDLPMYTPDEMIDMGISAPVLPEYEPTIVEGNEYTDEEFFFEYCNYFYSGMCSKRFLSLNATRVQMLKERELGLRDNDNTFAYGWNKNIPFTEANRIITDKRIRSIISERTNSSTFVDMRGFNFDESEVVNESLIRKDIVPVYIVLEEGKTPGFSKLVKKFSGGIYSHAMLSFDSSLTKLYSYGMDLKVNVLGGFIIENIEDKKRSIKSKNAKIKVYCIFIDKIARDNIKKNIDWFILHQKETLYSWRKLFAYLFEIPLEDKNSNYICSEFVDKMLKLGGVDFTKRNSNLVAPNDMDKMAKKNRKVYTIFSDIINKFQQARVDRVVNKLLSREKTKRFNESYYSYACNPQRLTFATKTYVDNIDVITCLSEGVNEELSGKHMNAIYKRLLSPCLEARHIPIKINKEGDLEIRKLAPIDFEAAYAKSHKLLVEYNQAGNIEGMKKELAYMWYLNILLEKRIYNATFKVPEEKKQEYQKARAKVMNDFKTYIKVVQKADKKFDFREYFENSDYSDAAYKVSSDTIKASFDLIKKLI